MAKTVSGAVDIVAKTSEGLENQTIDERRAMMVLTRIRKPRVFYETSSLIRPYNSFDSNWNYAASVAFNNFNFKFVYDFFKSPPVHKTFTSPSSSIKLRSSSWSVFILTRHIIYEIEFRQIKRADNQASEVTQELPLSYRESKGVIEPVGLPFISKIGEG